MEAQRIIDVIRQAVTQMTSNGARIEYRRGTSTTASAYQVSAYLSGSDVASDYIDVTPGLYVPVSAYIEVSDADDGRWVTKVIPSLFVRLAHDVVNGRIYLGSGASEPADPGSSGQMLMSGGAAGSAYWGSGLTLGSLTPVAVSTSGTAGTGTAAARDDHRHAHEAAHIAHDTIWDAKGDIVTGSTADTAVKTTVGADDTILMADTSAAGGVKWVAAGTPSTQAFGDSAVVGTSDTFTRGDHKHAMPSITAPTVNVYSSSTTWSKPAGLLYAVVEVIGAGGGGGGCPATNGSQRAASAGGGSGAYAKKTFTAAQLSGASSFTVTCGNAGGGGSGTGNGSDGGTSSFSGTGITTVSASGGAGGDGGLAVDSSTGADSAIGGAGGSTVSGGDINVPGNPGFNNSVLGGLPNYGGSGGTAPYGGAGQAAVNVAGTAGTFGSGGGGISHGVSQSSRSGGDGSGGIVIVTTYYQ